MHKLLTEKHNYNKLSRWKITRGKSESPLKLAEFVNLVTC